MLLREKRRSLASMLILMWCRPGLLGATLRFHPTQTFPSYQVRSRQAVSRSLICVCSLWISPSIEFSSSSSSSTSRSFSFLFFISKNNITATSYTLQQDSAPSLARTPQSLQQPNDNHERRRQDGPPGKKPDEARKELSLAVQLQSRGMGQKDSRTTIKEGWHEKFGKIELVSDPASPEAIYIRATLPAEEASAHARWWQMAQRLALSPVSGHLILPLRADQEQCLACSNSEGRPGLKVEYRWFRCSLQQDVKGRREIGHLYPENQLWYLMLVLLRAAAYFETQGSYLGNLHPSNLFIDEQGMLSLFTAFSAPREQENAQRIRASKYEDAFMAPEELPLGEEQTEGEEEEERKGEVVNQNKVDLFNIGLILLSTALLKDFYYLYNRNVFAINLEKLDQYKEQLGSVGALKYRKTLRTFILQFLQVDPSSRGLPSHYLSLLRPHENQILQLQDFDPESLLAVESSPQVVNYDDKASPNSKARRFLSLSKDCKDSKKSKETDASMDQEAFYRPARVERRLFGE